MNEPPRSLRDIVQAADAYREQVLGVRLPPRRSDCTLSHYVYRGGRSFCTAHPVDGCPFGVETLPTRRPWWQRLRRWWRRT